MKSCGVIVEYNPLHNGHLYHLQQAKERSQSDVIVAVMSGNFLQRGEPAIIDKWSRTALALSYGADVVIELPLAYAVQSADYFAKGGVKLLQALEVDGLCFGTDSPTPVDYDYFASFHQAHKDDIDALFNQLKNNGQSYPQQMTAVYRSLMPDWQLDFTSPNHILGMGYAKENITYPRPMTLYPIQRRQAGYHDDTIHPHFASATAIRQKVLDGEIAQIQTVVPKETFRMLQQQPLMSWDLFWPYVRYALTVTPVEQLQTIYQMTEGLEYRLKRAVRSAASFEELVNSVQTKRYTRTRIQRLLTYVLLYVTTQDIKHSWAHPSVRVLGFTEQGRAFLNQRKRTCPYPVITNVRKTDQASLALDIRAGEVYRQAAELAEPQDYFRRPLYSKET